MPLNGDPVLKFGGSSVGRGFQPGQLSPDLSTVVAASSCQSGAPSNCANGLILIDVASGEITQLTTQADDQDPHWSPDGTRIAFVRGSDRGVWVINTDGTGLNKLAAPTKKSVYDHDIAWSPDGTQIVFTSGQVTTFGHMGDVNVISAAGGQPQVLISDSIAAW